MMKTVRAAACLVSPLALALVSCTPFEAASGAADASSDAPVQAGDACAADRPCATGLCVAGVCVAAVSPCKGLHAARAELPSGVYEVSNALSRRAVYCDMTSFGGGWMLVGRSVASGAGNFGWRVAAGSVDDDSAPYSLGLTGPLEDVTFTEVLFGSRANGRAWGEYVYEHTVPPGFLTTFRTTATQQLDAVTVAGSCKPSGGGPTMLSRLGLTNRTDHFFFSDQVGTSSFGFWQDGWDTNGANANATNMCDYTGVLTGLQGMLHVR